jgi:hypothetical protein
LSGDGKVVVRITSDSSAERKYAIGAKAASLGLASLAVGLVEAKKSAMQSDTIFLYTEPGTRGFDVLMALKAARAAGFKESVGWADYTFEGESKSEPKRWSQSLSQIDGLAKPGEDSARKTIR